MAKFAGFPVTFSLDNTSGTPVNISNSIGSITLNTTRGEQDVTGLDKSAMERLQLLEDSEVTFGGNGFPPSTTRALFESLATSRTLTIDYPDSATATVEILLFSYNITRGQDGSLSWESVGRLCNGTALAWS